MSRTSLMAKLIAFRWCILCECKRVSVFGTRKPISRILCVIHVVFGKYPSTYVVATYNIFSVRLKLTQMLTITTGYFK